MRWLSLMRLVGDVSCEPTTLGVGEIAECAADELYVVTEDDEVAGSVDNTATATGVDPDDDAVESEEADTSTEVVTPEPELTLVKTAGTPVDVNGSGLIDAGDTIAFSFTVTNSGNVPVSAVGVVDALVGDVSCEPTTLGVGEEAVCAADEPYTVTEDDEVAGSVDNTATATGVDPDEGAVESEEADTSTEVVTPEPELSLVKTAGTPVDVNGSGLIDAGDTIAYSFTVTNSGNVPVSTVAVVDPLVGNVSCEPTTLGVGEEAVCTADEPYTVTEDDEAAGSVDNTATATGVDPDEGAVESEEADTSTEVVTPEPELSLVKTAGTPVDVNGSGLIDAGDTIAFSFTVTNSGNVPVSAVGITDALVGDVSCEPTTLGVGEEATCAADEPYTVTEDDEVAGSVDNTATATGVDPDEGAVESEEADTSTEVVTPEPELSLVKTAGTPVDVNGSGLIDAGDTIAYSFTVTNIGNVPVSTVAVVDPLAGAVTCDVTTLGVGEIAECAADELYVVTEDDEVAGSVDNTATATGVDPDEGAVESEEADTSTEVVTPEPELTLVKTAGTPVDVNNSGLVDAGDTIAYSFVVTNDGNVPVTGVAILDPLVGNVTCDPTDVGVGETASCTADQLYVVTEDDETDGSVDNTATATGVDPDEDSVESEVSRTTTEVDTPDPELTLVKTADAPVDVNGSGLVDAGDTIAYSFVVSNVGNVPATTVGVVDPLLGAVRCGVTTLAPGISTSCTADAPYVVTEDDEVAGSVDNTANATGVDPDGGLIESEESRTSTEVGSPLPALSVLKSAGDPVDVNGSGLVDAGDTIAYSFTVTNDGNVPLTAVEIVDDLVGAVTCTVPTLPPGDSTECEADELYVVTADDETATVVVNAAAAVAVDPDEDVVESLESSVIVPVSTPLPELSVVKTAGEPVDVNGSGIVDAGDTIAYSFTVTNDGNVPVSEVAVVDPLVGAVTCNPTELGVDETAECMADEVYVITEEDEVAGSVENSASGTALDPDGGEVESEDSSTSTEVDTPEPELSFVKTAGTPTDVNGSGLVDAGDTIAYSFTVTNDGNVPVSAVAVVDPLVGEVTCDLTTLGVGESAMCTGDAAYTVTDDDQVEGSVENSASATGLDPDGGEIESPTSDTSTEVATPDPALSVVKTAGVPVDVNESALVDAGDTIAYSFTVTNDGNVPVSALAIVDVLVGDVTCDVTTVQAGGVALCTADALYVIAEDDELTGSVDNSATAAGTDPDGDPVQSAASVTSTPVASPNPSVALTKLAEPPVDVNISGLVDAGDTIAYSFEVTNTGDVPLTALTIEDDTVGPITCDSTALAVEETTICRADDPYVVTDDDELAGSVENIATALTNDPDDQQIASPTSSTSVEVSIPDPGLALVKSAGAPQDVNGSGLVDAGDTIAYAFLVTNTGNVPLSLLSVVDPLAGTVTCGVTALAPGDSTSCTADEDYVVTEEDEVSGSVDNSATVTGVDPDGDGVESPGSVTSTEVATPSPALSVVKTAGTPVDVNGSGIVDAGDTIAYSFTVTNDGNVPLSSVAVEDPLVGGVTCDVATLGVGESAECAADQPYVVTDDDEVAGSVENSAMATALDPDGGELESVASETSTDVATPAPALSVVKTAGVPVDVNDSGIVDAGDTIAYSFTVTNDGNVPLISVVVVDPLVGTVGCDVGSLAPGEFASCTADDVYTVTEDDELSGEVTNVATANAVDPDGEQVGSPEATTSTPVQTPDPALSVVKVAGAPVDVNGSGLVDAGDTIEFSFVVSNIGNVPVADVAVVDPLLSGVTCDERTLAPGTSTLCAADTVYTVTDDDEVAGSVENSATATGTDPDQDEVVSLASVTSTEVGSPFPALSMVKSAEAPQDVNSSGLVDAGDTIAYSFVVTNVGNVPVSSVTVNDPLVGAVTCDEVTLAPGESTECAADEPYVVTDEDETSTAVVNSATASAQDPDEDLVSSLEASVIVPVSTPLPQLSLTKSAGDPVDVNGSGIPDAGDTISYSFVVTNEGNVPISAITVVDPLVGEVTCEADEVAVGESVSCAADAPYVITEDDEGAGAVLNSATVEGTDSDTDPVLSAAATTTTPVSTPAPTLSVLKSAENPVDVNDSGLVDAGDTIAYSFVVTNTGNVPITGADVLDELVGDVTCEETTVAPGVSTTCVADAPYVVTADDEIAGTVDNSATVSGDDPDGNGVTSLASTTSTDVASPDPSLRVLKTARPPVDVNGSGLVDAGDTVVYSFVVTNDGNVPITALVVNDPLLGDVICDQVSLAVGGSTSCAADAAYVITQEDEIVGSVDNVATVAGTDPNGADVLSPESTTSTAVGIPTPALALEKTAETPVDANNSGLVDAGDTIAYSFVATNVGNVTLDQLQIDDPLVGAVTCEESVLLAGGTTVCRADEVYVVTEVDEASGLVQNVATATAVEPGGDVIQSREAVATVPVSSPVVALTMVKSAAEPVDVNESGRVDGGDTIAYTFLVTNQGTVPLSGLAIEDPRLEGVTCAETTVAPGESVTCTGVSPYTVTQADQLAGSVLNMATASAIDPDGIAAAQVQSSVIVPVSPLLPGLFMVKSATWDDTDGDGFGDEGEQITYSFEVTNTGDADLQDLTVVDPMLSDRGVELDCSIAALPVGASQTCVAQYVITESDTRSEQLTNVASASAVGADGAEVSSGPSLASVPMAQDEPVPIPVPSPGPGPQPSPGPQPGPGPAPGPQESLPRTGSDVLPYLTLSGLFLGVGALMLAAARRRRTEESVGVTSDL